MVLKENEERTAKEKYEKKVLDDAERRRKNQENMSDVSHNYCYMYESPRGISILDTSRESLPYATFGPYFRFRNCIWIWFDEIFGTISV